MHATGCVEGPTYRDDERDTLDSPKRTDNDGITFCNARCFQIERGGDQFANGKIFLQALGASNTPYTIFSTIYASLCDNFQKT
jgi:hypothetical protein